MKNLFKKKSTSTQNTPAHNGGMTPGVVTPAASTPGGSQINRTPGGSGVNQTMVVSAHHYNQQAQLLYAAQRGDG